MSQPIISKANLKAYFDHCDGTGKGKVRMTYWPEVYMESLYYHTSFIDEHRPDLEESKKLPERKYCLKNNIFHPPMCVFCGEHIRKFDFKNTHGYRPFCVSNCSHKPKDKQKQQEMIDNNPIEESLVDDFYIPMTWEETIEMIKEHLMDENDHFMSNRCNRDYMFKNGLIHLMEAIEHYAHDECEEYFEKLYAVYYGYEERPYCSNCGVKKVNFGIRKDETKKGYLKFCSRDCSYSSEERISNSMKTIEDRYGVDSLTEYQKKFNKKRDQVIEKRRIIEVEDKIDFVSYQGYLNQKKLIDSLERYSGTKKVIREASIPGVSFRWDASMEIDGVPTLVEFDGHYHYKDPKTIVRDQQKDKIAKQHGYCVVRFPYWLQLDEVTLFNFFGIEGMDVDVSFEHGFITGKVHLPASFCEAGLERFERELNDLIMMTGGEKVYEKVRQSLINKIDENESIEIVLPKSLHYIVN